MNLIGSNSMLEDAQTAAPPALPLDLDLTQVSRHPARLREETFCTVMNSAIPIALRVQESIRPQASIAVVTFNNLVFTRMCLASLLGNTDRLSYEVIVVDNGSSDGTVEYLHHVAASNHHIRLILNETNRGFAPANNQAFAVAKGDILVLLNNDTIVPPGWLEGLISYLRTPAVGLVGPVTNRIGNEAEIEADYKSYGRFLDFAHHHRLVAHGRHFDIPRPCMFCLALRRDTYEQIGALDEQFEVGLFEDDDYALRVRAAGYRLVCAEDVFVHHFGQASFGTLVSAGEYGRLLEANKRQFEIKWGQQWQPYARRLNPAYEALKQSIRQVVCERTSPGATVLVISKGDEDLLDVLRAEGRGARHFPQAADGSFAGFYPADSAVAIAQLDELQAKGAEYLLFPSPSLWWLEYYKGLKEYLEVKCGEPLYQGEECILLQWKRLQSADLRLPIGCNGESSK